MGREISTFRMKDIIDYTKVSIFKIPLLGGAEVGLIFKNKTLTYIRTV
jgi:hypothetical protein